MNSLSQLLPKVEEYVTELLTKELPERLVYHNIDHTRRVVKFAGTIGIHENLNEEELNIVKTAAWFHDVGYLVQYRGHEEASIQIATDFLTDNEIKPEIVERIIECIRSTVVPQHPKNKISAVLCDADMMHVGLKKYPDLIKKLRKEWKNMGIISLSKKKFKKISIETLLNHNFHTDYCKGEITRIKEQNLRDLKNSIEIEHTAIKNNPDTERFYEQLPGETKNIIPKNKQKEKVNEKLKKYSRGADSMLRLTARNQINLSSIADNKSNILISLNGIIISLGLALLVRKFGERPEFIIPTLIFLLFSLTTIVLAILSTRPQVSSGKYTREDVKRKRVNLLFFGNFYNMDINEYEKSVGEMFEDDPYLYSAMIRDQYYLGKVLAKKYKLLRITYSIFMTGLIVSVLSFILIYLPL